MTDESDAPPPPTWVLVANVADGVDAGKIAPGAKVFVHSIVDGGEAVSVIGRHRGSRRLITVQLAPADLRHWRVKQIHKPALVERLAGGDIAGDEAAAHRLRDRYGRWE